MNITDEKFVLYYHTNPVVEYLTPDLEDGTVLHVSVRLIPDWTTPSMCDAEGTVTNGKVTFTLNTFTEEFQRVCRDYDMAYLEVYEDGEIRKVYLQRRIGIKARAGTLDGQPPSPTPDSYYTKSETDVLLNGKEDSGTAESAVNEHDNNDMAHNILFAGKEDAGTANNLLLTHDTSEDSHMGRIPNGFPQRGFIARNVYNGEWSNPELIWCPDESIINTTDVDVPINMCNGVVYAVNPNPTDEDIVTLSFRQTGSPNVLSYFGIRLKIPYVPVVFEGYDVDVLFSDGDVPPHYSINNPPPALNEIGKWYYLRCMYDPALQAVLVNLSFIV